MNSPLLASSLLLCAAACAGGSSNDVVAEPSQIATAMSQSVQAVAVVAPTQVALSEGLFSLPNATSVDEVNATSCSDLENLLNQSCGLIAGLTGESDSYCYAESTFFMAHSLPRCASRLHLTGEMERIYAFDLTGQSTKQVDTCGNSVLDGDEECDDGNREDFDGCSQNCEEEEFQGCEAVIEQYFQQAQIAFVDKNKWNGPRSHLMINPTARALGSVDQSTCDAALAVGVDVCNELTRQMPFVTSCQPMGGMRQGEDAVCDLRFLVYFGQVSPADGVFTTALPGILAFTIAE